MATVRPLLFTAALLFAALPQVSASPAQNPPAKGRAAEIFLQDQERERAQAKEKADADRKQRQAMLLALRLNEAGTECVAYDPSHAACLVTVEEFNDALEGRAFPAADSGSDVPGPQRIQAMQASVLKEILADRYAADSSLGGPARDSLMQSFETARGKRIRAFAANLGEDSLRALYRRHYADQFQGREERNYRVLASSDSALADSLARDPKAPWQRATEAALPPATRDASRRLKPGETSRPIETPFARLYVRLESSRRIPDTRFEDALPILISLATRAQSESDQDQRVSEYYRANKNEFQSPDTLAFRIWLAPAAPRKGSLQQRLREDTTRVATRMTDQTRLPDFLRDELQYYPALRPGDFLGPIRSVLGTWYLQVMNIRRGGRPLSLAEARPRILKLIYGSTETGPADLARQEAASKDRELLKTLAGPLLTGAGGRAAYDEWMRARLSIRFIRLPDSDPGKTGNP
jgi:hypothetical protein